MKQSAAGSGALRITGFGHAVFAATMIALGVMGLAKGGFVPFWTGVPKDLPARTALAYLCAVISLGSGVGILWRRTAGIASSVLLVSLALWMLLFRVRLLLGTPTAPGLWWACGEIAVMMAGAWVLVVWFAGDRGEQPGFLTSDKGLYVARVLYGLGVIAFGVAHFTFLERTVSMVPGWLPWHLGWAYFTGIALIAAGVAVIVGVCARLAAVLSAWELSLFTVLVWLPVVVAGADASQWNEVIDSCALTAAAWVVADSYRGMPWLTRGTRSLQGAGADHSA